MTPTIPTTTPSSTTPPGRAWSARGDGGEPPIDLDTMLDLTAAAEVDGVKFDGFDLFLFEPHINIDATDDELKTPGRQGPARGTWRSARSWPRSGRRPAAARRWATPAERKQFLGQVRKGCRIAKRLRELGVRPNGVVRIDSACGVEAWCDDPEGNQKRIAETFREACKIAEDHGERLAAEGEICWGGMHSWRRMLELLEMVDRPADARLPGRHGPHAALPAGLQRPGRRHAAAGFRLERPRRSSTQAYETLTAALRPWTIDFHVAQNDAHGPRLRLARQDRPPLPGRPTPTASSTSPATPATGSATTNGRADQEDPPHLLGRLHVPQRRDDEAADVERHPARR